MKWLLLVFRRRARAFSHRRQARAAQAFGILAALLVVSAGSARADDVPEATGLVLVPTECLPYWSNPGGSGSMARWNQVLSFAACIQDASIASIEDPDRLPALVPQLELALAPALQLYVAAMQYGPRSVQLRATFQIGMTQVALITRARASLVVPSDRGSNPAAAARYRELQERLEPLLAKPAQFAWTLFVLIDRAVAEDPTIMTDDVTRNMVRASRELERSLRWSTRPTNEETPTRPLIASPR